MARKNSFSVGEAISFGWNTVKKNPIVILYVLIPMIVPPVLNQILSTFVGKNPHIIILVLLIVINLVVSLTVSIGLIKVLLTLAAGKKVDISDFYTGYPLVLRYFLASLLSGLVVAGVAVVALAVGGVLYFALNAVIHDASVMQIVIVLGVAVLAVAILYISVKLSMWKYLLIDKKMSAVESVKKSWDITSGSELKLVLFILASLGITILGIIVLVVGILVALPIIQLGNVYIYKKLSSGK